MNRIFTLFGSAVFALIVCACGNPAAVLEDSTRIEITPAAAPDPTPAPFTLTLADSLPDAAGFLNPRTGYILARHAGYPGGVTMFTSDGGQTWEYRAMELQDCVQFCNTHSADFLNAENLWLTTDDGQVHYSDDGGIHWHIVTNPGPKVSLPFVSFLDLQTGWVAWPSDLFSTTDGGATWTTLSLPEDAAGIAAVDLRTPSDGYVLSGSGLLFVTGDAGASWRSIDLGLGKPVLIGAEMPMAAMRFPDAEHGVIVLGLKDDDGRVMAVRTSDGGLTWQRTELPIRLGAFRLSKDGEILTRAQSVEINVLPLDAP
jgi:photosystem II stability/assembly factor-like uncharacterized protein